MPRGDGVDDATLDDFVNQFPWCPVGYWTVAFLRLLTTYGNAPRELFSRECRLPARAVFVTDHIDQKIAQVLVASALFLSLSKSLLLLQPTPSPSAWLLPIDI